MIRKGICGCLFLLGLSVLRLTAQPEYAKVLSQYIQFPSLQKHEKPAGGFFMKICREKGLTIEVLDTTEQSINFIASLYPLSEKLPNIVFLNHIDVVNPGEVKDWKFPPFSGKIEDSTIWGRGTIDNKGMAVAELFGLSAFAEKYDQQLPFNVSLLCVSGEETGGHRGAIPVAKTYLDKINPVLILGEGGSGVRGLLASDPHRAVFGTSTVEKSKLVLHLDLKIKSSGHGSVPPKEYATKAMVLALQELLTRKREIIFSRIPVNALKRIGRSEKGIRGFVLSHLTFFVFKPIVKKQIKQDPVIASFFTNTITLTNLSALETDHNQISDHISATLDCRLIPGTDIKQFIRFVKRKLNDKRIQVTIEHEEKTGNRTLNPYYFVTLCQALKKAYPDALNLEIIFPATTDNFIFRERGITVFGLFPAVFTEEELKSIHSIDERIHFNQLEKAILVYQTFLEKIAQNGINKKLSRREFNQTAQ